MYADDTSLSFSSNSISTINEKVNEDLECLNTWLAGNRLSLNVAKTNSIVIGSRKKVKDIQQTSAMKPSLVIRISFHISYLILLRRVALQQVGFQGALR